MSILDRQFELTARRTTVARELRGAVATFLTMAYILAANAQILKAAGVPAQSAVACTALAAGVCSIFMGLWANFPLGLASGMGLNAFVASLVLTHKVPDWQTAMGLVVWDGVLVLVLVVAGLREAVMAAIPRDLRLAIGAGIGLFIAFIGLQQAGLVQRGQPPAPPVGPGDFHQVRTIVSVVGLIVTSVLMVWRVRGAIVIGIATATVLAFATGVAKVEPGLFAHVPRPHFETVFQANLGGALRWSLVPLLLALVMVDFFDTLGTATAVAEEAELIRPDGRIPGLRHILVVDAVSASIGGLLGVSSVTSYVESAAGVAEGARTGLYSVFVGLMFLACVVAAPVVALVPEGATAPALVLVGFYMIAHVGSVDFTRLETAVPAFLILVGIPLTYSISHGIGYGFIAYVVIQSARFRFRDVHPVMYAAAIAFAAYFGMGQG